MDKKHRSTRVIAWLVVPWGLGSLVASACAGGTTSRPSTSGGTPASTVSPSASPEPTASPSTSPLASATTAVYYDIVTAFIPYGDASKVKRTRVTLVFQKLRDGAGAADPTRFEGPAINHSPQLDEPSPIDLEPGKYEVTSIVFPPKALGTHKDVTAFVFNGRGNDLHGPTFVVPEADCAYLGSLTLAFVRLAPTKKAQDQLDLVGEASMGATVSLTILAQGSLVWFVNDRDAITVTVDPSAQQASGAERCSVKPFKDPVK